MRQMLEPQHVAIPARGIHERVAPSVFAAVAIFLATVFQRGASPIYDAYNYWQAAVDVVHGTSPFRDGLLDLRGVWTAVLYVPAAAVSRVAGANSAAFAILVENAILLAILGAVLVPRVVGIWRPVTPLAVYLSAGGVWLLLARFAPYTLTDVWAVALIFGAVVLLAHPSAMRLAAAGLCGAIAVNVRPAYLVTVALLAVLLLVWRRWRAISFIGAAVLGLLPQSIINIARGYSWQPLPLSRIN